MTDDAPRPTLDRKQAKIIKKALRRHANATKSHQKSRRGLGRLRYR